MLLWRASAILQRQSCRSRPQRNRELVLRGVAESVCLFLSRGAVSALLYTGRKRQMKTVRSFVGMDVHKTTISISIAEDGRSGPIRFLGVIPNTADEVAKLAKRLAKHGELDFCYEASGCGYGIHRQLTALGHRGMVVAPS